MNDSALRLEAVIFKGIEKIPRAHWNALLAEDDSPFVEWDWLHALESSGSAGSATGWVPCHMVLREARGGRILAACPLYLKGHSMGEFVFDHGWAEAARRAGISYYPKLLVGIPFTPHGGRRFLTRPGLDRARLISLMGGALAEFCVDNKLSSVHVNFCAADEAAALGGVGFLERLGYQYHWLNPGYRSFEDYLGRLRHKRRTAVRHERSALGSQRVTIRVLAGDEIPDGMFPVMYQIYLSTIEKLYWGRQYLNEEFFDLIRQNFKRYICFMAAYRGRELIAGTINLQRSGVLYGRYWGCFRELRYLHFNVCYYAAIEHCIRQGIGRFEPGAGGEYKWLRGFDPAITRSMHFIAHAGFREAVADFLRQERREVKAWIRAGRARSQLKAPPPSDLERR